MRDRQQTMAVGVGGWGVVGLGWVGVQIVQGVGEGGSGVVEVVMRGGGQRK